jgi:hypothetical protein
MKVIWTKIYDSKGRKIKSFRLDPWEPGRFAYVATSAGIQRIKLG